MRVIKKGPSIPKGLFDQTTRLKQLPKLTGSGQGPHNPNKMYRNITPKKHFFIVAASFSTLHAIGAPCTASKTTHSAPTQPSHSAPTMTTTGPALRRRRLRRAKGNKDSMVSRAGRPRMPRTVESDGTSYSRSRDVLRNGVEQLDKTGFHLA